MSKPISAAMREITFAVFSLSLISTALLSMLFLLQISIESLYLVDPLMLFFSGLICIGSASANLLTHKEGIREKRQGGVQS